LLAKLAHNSKELALPSNLDAMAPDDSRKTIAELIATLPEEERLILTLHLVNMISVTEIADKLGVPERAVISVITSGRSRLIGLIS
jgi:DNA-directed RNA polymerase specialized sigma24 family protein